MRIFYLARRTSVLVFILIVYPAFFYSFSLVLNDDEAIFKTVVSSVFYLLYVIQLSYKHKSVISRLRLRLRLKVDSCIGLMAAVITSVYWYESIEIIILNVVFFNSVFMYMTSSAFKNVLTEIIKK